MKAYMNHNGKGRWSSFWGDKVKPKFKKVFKKSGRQALNRDTQEQVNG